MTPLYFDTETELFGPGNQHPNIVCLSYLFDGESGLLKGDDPDAYALLRAALEDPDCLLVGHNVAYDFGCILEKWPDLWPLVVAAYEADRVTDTLLRQKLLDLSIDQLKFRNVRTTAAHRAEGKRGPWQKAKSKFDLATCHELATGVALDKDGTWRLRYGELKDAPLDDWPADARQYALDDAKGAGTVYEWQEAQAKKINRAHGKIQYLKRPNVLADQFRQARAAIWLQFMRAHGIRTNQKAVAKLKAEIQVRYEENLSTLQMSGLIRADGSRNIKAATERMIAVKGTKKKCVLTEKGNVQLDKYACEACGDPILGMYTAHTSLGTLLSKDVPALELGLDGPIHTSINSLLATGRTSSYKPNIQNISREGGIRECYVPREGKVFINADYDTLELRALAQVCLKLFGKSKLARALNAGRDPHLEVAAQILGISYDVAKSRYKDGDKDVKAKRQLGKVLNFGLPGGLGPKALIAYAKSTYDVIFTEKQAKKLKDTWLKTYPEMKLYFAHIRSICRFVGDDGRTTGYVQQIFSGRIRGGAHFTNAANSFFQGLGADATKAAGFEILKACYVNEASPLYGCRIVNYIHDEFILECDEDRAHDAAWELARLMVKGAAPFLPDVAPSVSEPLVCRVWSKDAKQVFDDSGRLVPWELQI